MYRFGILLRVALCAFAASPMAAEPEGRGEATHVVLVAWDGMRPDFVSPENTPALWQLAQRGVTFRNHHSVYPSLTSVNATALATGVYPGRSGVLGNYEYRPAIDLAKLVRMDEETTIREGDRTSDGRYLGAATIAEIVQTHGGSAALAGTKTASLLHGRHPAKDSGSVTLFDGATLPPTALAQMVKLLGPFPREKEAPNAMKDAWTTRALTEVLWKDEIPEFSLLWMSDPDRAQHASAPGSPEAIAGIRSADTNFAVVLHALEEKKALAQTDVLVVSDHGFSTIARGFDIPAQLRAAGFTVAEGADPLRRGDIRFAGNGGSAFFYVGEHDDKTAGRLVTWLQQTDFAGVIFSRAGDAGTFPLAQFHLDAPSAPDVVVAMRWTESENEFAIRGLIAATTGKEVAAGTHGTLSRFDIHNTLIAAGPDFQVGGASDLPSSNLDVVPTILHLLGLAPPQPLDGRVLSESLQRPGDPPLAAIVQVKEKTRQLEHGKWRQYVRTSAVGDSVYADEGNGEFTPE
ncbi:MAG: alkaline phosphatase family protein [Chthoniobacterales bacterium]